MQKRLTLSDTTIFEELDESAQRAPEVQFGFYE